MVVPACGVQAVLGIYVVGVLGFLGIRVLG